MNHDGVLDIEIVEHYYPPTSEFCLRHFKFLLHNTIGLFSC